MNYFWISNLMKKKTRKPSKQSAGIIALFYQGFGSFYFVIPRSPIWLFKAFHICTIFLILSLSDIFMRFGFPPSSNDRKKECLHQFHSVQTHRPLCPAFLSNPPPTKKYSFSWNLHRRTQPNQYQNRLFPHLLRKSLFRIPSRTSRLHLLRHILPKSSVIRKVLLQKSALSGEKLPAQSAHG